MLEAITHEAFTPLLHDRFRVELDPVRIDLQLERVDVSGQRPEEGQRQAFSLLFSGVAEEPLPQHLYPLSHDALGTLEVFLVPIGPQADGRMGYEAVFN